MQNTIQMETLASVGYFVLAIDHSYDANITLFDDGTHADFRSAAEDDLSVQEFWDLRIPQINTRSDDVLFVLDEIESFLDLNIPFWLLDFFLSLLLFDIFFGYHVLYSFILY